MVESNTTQDTGTFPEVDEDEDGPFSDWDLGIHDDHWALLVPKRSALNLITAKHGVDARTAEALFFDVFCLKFSNFPRRVSCGRCFLSNRYFGVFSSC